MLRKSYRSILKIMLCLLILWFTTGLFRKSFCQVISYQTGVIIDEKGKKTTTRIIIVQVNNKQENWLSHVELAHNPKQEFSFNYAQIVGKDGNVVRKLKKKELITRNELSYQTFYQDDLITEFDLYWNQYPYKVEYSYTIVEEEYLYVAWWSPVLYSNLTSVESSLEISLPSDYEVQISTENTIYKESHVDGKRVLIWQLYNQKKERNEVYSPPNEKIVQFVRVIPINFRYGVSGSTDTWASLGFWLDELNQGTDQITPEEQRVLDRQVNGIENEYEIIRAIYHYLQDNTKYVNVAIDVGGLKSYPASYVCKNKYGDCKALTTYMKAMLKSVGIESFFTIIRAGENEAEIDLNFPSQQFNHVILMVPIESDTIWLENTSNALPFNYLGTFTQDRFALAVKGKESQLVKTPKLSFSDVLLYREYSFELPENNEGIFKLNLELRGREFENFRYFLSNNNEKGQNDKIRMHIGVNDVKFKEWNISNYNRDSTFVGINIDGIAPSIVREIGSLRVINPLRIDVPAFEKPDDRKLDLVVNYPISRLDRSVYELSSIDNGINEIQIPDGINIECEYGQYYTIYVQKEEKLIVEEKFRLFSNRIKVEYYKDFYRFIESINNHKKKAAIIIK